MIYGGRPSSEAAPATHAVWTGRIHPFHLGHLAVLERSIRTWEIPHIAGLVCHDYELMSREPAGKHSPPYNAFTAWERYRMIQLCLKAVGLDGAVDTIFIPYMEPKDWPAIRQYLPGGCLRCTTNKDADDTRAANIWRTHGWNVAVLDVSDLNLLTSSALRKSVLEGEDWRRFLHASLHEYFQTIDGPARLLESARAVAALEQGYPRCPR
jgi:nicotinamide mononucleotide adenylyltransferase